MTTPPATPCPWHGQPSCRVCSYASSVTDPSRVVWVPSPAPVQSEPSDLQQAYRELHEAREALAMVEHGADPVPAESRYIRALDRYNHVKDRTAAAPPIDGAGVCYCAGGTLGHSFGLGACHAALPVPQQPPAAPDCVKEHPHPGTCRDGDGFYLPETGEPLPQHDAVDHPAHYTSSPAACSGCGKPIECIDVVQHMPFNRGNAVKYLWRADLKDDAIEDLRKAVRYLQFEIARLEAATPAPRPASRLRTREEMRAAYTPLGVGGLRAAMGDQA